MSSRASPQLGELVFVLIFLIISDNNFSLSGCLDLIFAITLVYSHPFIPKVDWFQESPLQT